MFPEPCFGSPRSVVPIPERYSRDRFSVLNDFRMFSPTFGIEQTPTNSHNGLFDIWKSEGRSFWPCVFLFHRFDLLDTSRVCPVNEIARMGGTEIRGRQTTNSSPYLFSPVGWDWFHPPTERVSWLSNSPRVVLLISCSNELSLVIAGFVGLVGVFIVTTQRTTSTVKHLNCLEFSTDPPRVCLPNLHRFLSYYFLFPYKKWYHFTTASQQKITVSDLYRAHYVVLKADNSLLIGAGIERGLSDFYNPVPPAGKSTDGELAPRFGRFATPCGFKSRSPNHERCRNRQLTIRVTAPNTTKAMSQAREPLRIELLILLAHLNPKQKTFRSICIDSAIIPFDWVPRYADTKRLPLLSKQDHAS